MTAALEGSEWSAARPGRTFPQERAGTHFTGGWVGPRAGLDGRKFSSPLGFDPGTSSPQLATVYCDIDKGSNHILDEEWIILLVLCNILVQGTFHLFKSLILNTITSNLFSTRRHREISYLHLNCSHVRAVHITYSTWAVSEWAVSSK